MRVIVYDNIYAKEAAAKLVKLGIETVLEPCKKQLAKFADSGENVLVIGAEVAPALLTDDKAADKAIAKINKGQQVVLQLDTVCESNPYIVQLALKRAEYFAKKQRETIVLLKQARTTLPGCEELYAKARKAGAVVFKYNSAACNGEVYEVEGEGCNLSLNVGLFIDCELTQDVKCQEALKLLRLKDGVDKCFVFPVETSRKGVYYFNGLLFKSNPELVDLVALYIKKALNGAEPELKGDVNAEKCAFCYTCYRACPHGALLPDSKAAAMKVNEEKCQGCGICAAICPANAIKMQCSCGTEVNLDAPKAKTIVFACENSAYVAAKKALEGKGDVELKSIPCGGRISVENIADAIVKYEKVVVATCVDDACIHFDGNKRAKLQCAKVLSSLKELSVDCDKLSVIQLAHSQVEGFIDLIK